MILLIYIMSFVLVTGVVIWSIQPSDVQADIDSLKYFLTSKNSKS